MKYFIIYERSNQHIIVEITTNEQRAKALCRLFPKCAYRTFVSHPRKKLPATGLYRGCMRLSDGLIPLLYKCERGDAWRSWCECPKEADIRGEYLWLTTEAPDYQVAKMKLIKAGKMWKEKNRDRERN